MAMQHQKLTDITRGLQNAAAETNALVADQFIRILSQYFDHLEDGTLKAKMVRVQLDDRHYSLVPLVSLAAPSGLALDQMRVKLSIRLEDAEEERVNLLRRDRAAGGDEEGDISRSQFRVSLSPRSKGKGKGRPSDHVEIELKFKSLETPKSIQRVIETYTNMIEPVVIPVKDEAPQPDDPEGGHDDGGNDVEDDHGDDKPDDATGGERPQA